MLLCVMLNAFFLYAEYKILLNVIVLSIVMLNVIISYAECHYVHLCRMSLFVM